MDVRSSDTRELSAPSVLSKVEIGAITTGPESPYCGPVVRLFPRVVNAVHTLEQSLERSSTGRDSVDGIRCHGFADSVPTANFPAPSNAECRVDVIGRRSDGDYLDG